MRFEKRFEKRLDNTLRRYYTTLYKTLNIMNNLDVGNGNVKYNLKIIRIQIGNHW